jgi:hypothetical protein
MFIHNDSREYTVVIHDFADPKTQRVWGTGKTKRLPANPVK